MAVVKTEDWIRYEDVELHEIVDRDEYERSRLVKFRPVDAARCELMRFRVRPRVNVELPLQIGVQMSVSGRRIELRADLLIPGYYCPVPPPPPPVSPGLVFAGGRPGAPC